MAHVSKRSGRVSLMLLPHPGSRNVQVSVFGMRDMRLTIVAFRCDTSEETRVQR